MTRLHHRHTSVLLFTHAGHTPLFASPLSYLCARPFCRSIFHLFLSSPSLPLRLPSLPLRLYFLWFFVLLSHAERRSQLLVSIVESNGLIALHLQLRDLAARELIR